MTYPHWTPLTSRSAPGLRTRLLWTALDAGCGWRASSSPPGCASTSTITDLYATPLAIASVVVIVVHVSVGWLFGPYAVGHELGSFEETAEVARAASVAGFVLATLTFLFGVVDLPRSVPLTALALAVIGMFAARFLIRSRRTHLAVRGDCTKRAVIFGAGSGARILMQSLVRDPASGIVPGGPARRRPRQGSPALLRGAGARHPARPRRRSPRSTGPPPWSSPCPAPPRRPSASCPRSPARAASRCSCSRRCASCSTAAPRPPTCATSTSPTCSAASRCTSTWPRSPTRSAASGCSSPVPAARSAPSCAARSASSAPRTCSCSTATRAACTPPSCRSRGGRRSTATTSCCATSATSTPCRRPSSAAAPRSSSTRPRSST